MAPEIKITLPNDRTVAGYDLSALEGAILKHREQIKMFEDGIANEKAQMEALSSIINRKRELEQGPRPHRG
jgi:hypothetical protein